MCSYRLPPLCRILITTSLFMFSQRVGHGVPGVVVWSLSVELVGVGNARHISISLLEAETASSTRG